MIETVAEETARLRADDPPLLGPREALCPSCRLAANEGGFSWGVCADCLAEQITLSVRAPLP